MWVFMNNCFLSIVHKDCQPDELLVRARRKGDIEKVFPDAKVTRYTKSDYLYRAVINRDIVMATIAEQVYDINYPNFKDTVEDEVLHDLYSDVWLIMSEAQELPPYSGGK